MNAAEFVLVLVAGLLSGLAVPVAYLTWLRVVGLKSTAGRQFVALPTWIRVPMAVLVGLAIGGGLQIAPTFSAAIALITLLAASTLAGLVLFESLSARRH